MKDVLFVNPTLKGDLRSRINGTMILATKLLQAGFDVDVLHFYQIGNYGKGDYYQFVEDTTNRILSEKPRCVSFFAVFSTYHIILRIAQRLKEQDPSIITVMGGPQASATAYDTMKAMDFIDYIATGEGENTVIPFFTALLRNNGENVENIPGLYYRKDGKIDFCHAPIQLCDVNTIPHWDDRLCVTEEKEADSLDYFMPIDAGRGCPFHCTFCSTSVFWKRAYRLKSPERILEDIRFFNEKYGIRSFLFSHDALTANEKLMTEVCDHIIESGLDIKWRCTTRADLLSENLILKMKQAGVRLVEIGIETGSPRMQKLTNKKLDLEKVKKTVKFLVQNKINVTLFFMYGFPEETEDDLNQTLNLHSDFLEMGVKHSVVVFCKFIPSADITNRYFDQLVFDPKIKVLARKKFGFTEELEMIQNNKKLFPFFHHLSTPVRDNYQYLVYFLFIHRQFPNTLRFIRAYYKNDFLRFYRDFHNNNSDIFDCDIAIIQKTFEENPQQILLKSFKHFDKSVYDRFEALVNYEIDLKKVKKSKEDTCIQKTYAFNYMEYTMQLPIDQFSDDSTTLLIEKKDGRLRLQVISI